MTAIDTIFQENILDELARITTVNGFENNVSVLDGYLVHYANDLMNNVDGVSFPCVAVQPELDVVENNQNKTRGKITRQMKLVGAVNATDRALVNSKLNSLVLDTRKALAINKYDNNSLATDITLGNTVFALPDSKDQYAFFEMDLSITYVENWK